MTTSSIKPLRTLQSLVITIINVQFEMMNFSYEGTEEEKHDAYLLRAFLMQCNQFLLMFTATPIAYLCTTCSPIFFLCLTLFFLFEMDPRFFASRDIHLCKAMHSFINYLWIVARDRPDHTQIVDFSQESSLFFQMQPRATFRENIYMGLKIFILYNKLCDK